MKRIGNALEIEDSPPAGLDPESGGVVWEAVQRRWLRAIILIAVVMRVGLLIFAEYRPQLFDFPDSHRYLKVARNIASGSGPIESSDVRAGTDPLYSFLISCGIRLGFHSEPSLMRFGRLINVVFSIASIFMIVGFARQLVGLRVALIAAALLAVDPILLFFNALVLTETCYITLLIASGYGLIHLRIHPSNDGHFIAMRLMGWAVFSGVCLGLGTLLRSSNLFMPLLMIPWVWHFSGRANEHRSGQRLAVVIGFLLSAALVLMPRVSRNAHVFGAFVPLRTGSGASLLEALGPWADGAPGMDRIVYPPFPAGADEVVRDRICRRWAMNWAWTNPLKSFKLAWFKLRRTWSITLHANDYTSPVYRLICWVTVFPEFVMIIGGAWFLRRQPAVVGLLLAPALYFTLIHMVFVGSVRYRVPAMPFLFILAATAFYKTYRMQRRKQTD